MAGTKYNSTGFNIHQISFAWVWSFSNPLLLQTIHGKVHKKLSTAWVVIILRLHDI